VDEDDGVGYGDNDGATKMAGVSMTARLAIEALSKRGKAKTLPRLAA
jgi:hypothetical protein